MEYQKLTHQPLSIVLAEFKFSAVLLMEKFIAGIQEDLRDEYPDFKRRTGHTITLTPGDEAPTITDNSVTYWELSSEDRSQLIRIDPENVIVASTDYGRFPTFLKSCQRAISTIHDHVGLKILNRVGLRYCDTVIPAPDKELSDYLEPEVLPGNAVIGLSNFIRLHRSETSLDTGEGKTLKIQVLAGMHQLAVFPDLRHTFSEVQWPEIPKDHATAILDFDHFWEPPSKERPSFAVDFASEKLAELHEVARQAFWDLTTSKAKMEYWK